MWGRSNWARKGEGGGLGNRDTTFSTPLAGRLSPVASTGDPLPCPESQETWNLERSFFPNSLREPEKNVFLTVAYSHSPKSTSLRKSCVCAEGSSSRCLACTPFVQESVPFLFYVTQRGRDNPPRLPPIPLSPVAVTGNFWLERWAEKATRVQTGFWGWGQG